MKYTPEAVKELDPEIDRETAQAVAQHMTRSARKYRSNYWRTSGAEGYQNKSGRCEDAPCCGCCS